MTSLADLLGQTELPLTVPLEDQMSTDDTDTDTAHPLFAAIIAVAVLAGIAVIVAGIVLGGPWRWAGGGVAVIGIAAIVAPAVADRKDDNDIEAER